jgi:hypothetical protein
MMNNPDMMEMMKKMKEQDITKLRWLNFFQ